MHWLFVRVRIDQYREAENAGVRTEDYFVHLPLGDKEITKIPSRRTPLLKELSIHYCTLGEMLFTMLLWRCLSAASSSGQGAFSLGQLNIGLKDSSGDARSCTWQQANLFLQSNVDADPDTPKYLKELRGLWGKQIGPQATWQKEWQLLGIEKMATNGSMSYEREALIRFASEIGVFKSSLKPLTLSDDDVNCAVQRSVGLFLDLLGVTTAPKTIDEALDAIEKHARFPILPFYVWQVLDQAPKCYLVSPAWTSQHHSVEVRGHHHCRHLGLAISAVSPLKRLDWTLPVKHLDSNSDCASDADPVVIVNVLRLMARPLVEGRLYQKLAKEVEAILEAKVKKQVKAAIKHLSRRKRKE